MWTCTGNGNYIFCLPITCERGWQISSVVQKVEVNRRKRPAAQYPFAAQVKKIYADDHYNNEKFSMPFNNPPLEEIKALLQQTKTIAVVGLSPKSERPSHGVSRAMQGFGYRIIPVRPAVEEVLGEKAWPDLYALPNTPDLVNVFRAPEHVGPIIDACVELGIKAVWLQDGVINEEAALNAQQAGMTVVMDRCVYRDYMQLIT